MPMSEQHTLRELPPRFWRPVFSLGIGLLLLLAAGVGAIMAGSGRIAVKVGMIEIGPGHVLFGLLAAAGVAVGTKWIQRRLPRFVVRLEPDGVLVPAPFRLCARLVAYPEVVSLQVHRGWLMGRTLLAIGASRRGPALLSQRRFGSPEALARFRDALLEQIEATCGPTQRERVEARSRADQHPLRAPWLALALVVAITWLFWLQSFHGGLSTAAGYHWGLVKGLTVGGDFYRVVTASWLHGDPVHLTVNVLGLTFFGWLAERVLGWRRMLGIGMSSACISVVAALPAMRPFDVGLGISGWVFGWIGAWIWLWARYRVALPPLLQRHGLVLGTGFLLLVQWGGGGAQDAVHITGLFVGMAVTAAMTRSWDVDREPLGAASGRWIVGTSAALVALAVGWGLVDGRDGGEADGRLVLHWMLDYPDLEGTTRVELTDDLNSAAWHAAAAPKASSKWLLQAERAAVWATENANDEQRSRTLVILATLRYRLCRFDSAVDLAWQAVDVASADDPAEVLVTSAARFELARWRAEGAMLGDGAPAAAIVLAADGSALRASLGGPLDGGATIHAVGFEGETPRAHVRLRLESAAPEASVEVPLGAEDAAALAGCTEFVTTRTEIVGDRTGSPRVVVQPLDEDTLGLP